MRCPVCEANKDGKCMAGVIPYKSKKSVDGIGCNLNRRTVKKRMRDENMGGIYIPNMTEEMAKEHLRGFIYIPVPPHGRLIEESKVLDIVSEWCPDDDGSVGKVGDLREMLDEIEALPTIIPAEEDE